MIAFASSSTALFQSTLPSQGATNSSTRRFAVSLHFNPRSPHRERLYAQFNKYFEEQFQSTLPSQGATRPSRKRKQWQKISIHAPLTGSDKKRLILTIQEYLFQSTLPSQGATNCSIKSSSSLENFNPRSPHRERLGISISNSSLYHISIHAPLTGSDKCSHFLRRRTGTFQSTLPSQGATANIHIKFLCDLLFSTLSSKNSFTLSRFPQTIT